MTTERIAPHLAARFLRDRLRGTSRLTPRATGRGTGPAGYLDFGGSSLLSGGAKGAHRVRISPFTSMGSSRDTGSDYSYVFGWHGRLAREGTPSRRGMI